LPHFPAVHLFRRGAGVNPNGVDRPRSVFAADAATEWIL
jgi:hypothetical protein